MAMIRKQIYIEESQDSKLKRLAKTRGISEAELIRRAIDGLDSGQSTAVREVATVRYSTSRERNEDRWRDLDDQAWVEELAFIESRSQELGATGGSTHKFNREDAYRGKRFGVPD